MLNGKKTNICTAKDAHIILVSVVLVCQLNRPFILSWVHRDCKLSKILTWHVGYQQAKTKGVGLGNLCVLASLPQKNVSKNLYGQTTIVLRAYLSCNQCSLRSIDVMAKGVPSITVKTYMYRDHSPFYNALCSKFYWCATDFFPLNDKCTCFTFKSLLCHFNRLVFGRSLQPFQIFEKNVKVLIGDLQKLKGVS